MFGNSTPYPQEIDNEDDYDPFATTNSAISGQPLSIPTFDKIFPINTTFKNAPVTPSTSISTNTQEKEVIVNVASYFPKKLKNPAPPTDVSVEIGRDLTPRALYNEMSLEEIEEQQKLLQKIKMDKEYTCLFKQLMLDGVYIYNPFNSEILVVLSSDISLKVLPVVLDTKSNIETILSTTNSVVSVEQISKEDLSSLIELWYDEVNQEYINGLFELANWLKPNMGTGDLVTE